MGQRRRRQADQGGGEPGRGRVLGRYIEVSANARADIGQGRDVLLGRAQQGQDRGFLRIGIGFQEGRGNLGLRVACLSGEKAGDHAHHIHYATLRRSHATRRWLTNAGGFTVSGSACRRDSHKSRAGFFGRASRPRRILRATDTAGIWSRRAPHAAPA